MSKPWIDWWVSKCELAWRGCLVESFPFYVLACLTCLCMDLRFTWKWFCLCVRTWVACFLFSLHKCCLCMYVSSRECHVECFSLHENYLDGSLSLYGECAASRVLFALIAFFCILFLSLFFVYLPTCYSLTCFAYWNPQKSSKRKVWYKPDLSSYYVSWYE